MADIIDNQNQVPNSLNSNTSGTPIQTPNDATNASPVTTDPNVVIEAPAGGTVDTQHSEDLDMRWNKWKCMNCNYVYEGVKPLNVCPRCGNSDPDKFQDMD